MTSIGEALGAVNARATMQAALPRPRIGLGSVNINALIAYALVSPPLFVMLLLIFFPAGQAIIRTLFIENETGAIGFSVNNYVNFFSDRIALSNLWFTVWVTVATVVGLFLVCFPIALYLRFAHGVLAAIVQVLALFPLFVPGIILAFALIRFLGPRGMVETALNLVGIQGYTSPYLKPSGIIIGLIWDYIPFTVLVLTAGLRQVEDALIESARDVGAGGWTVFRSIVLPLMDRPVLIVFCLNFISVFGAFTIPYLLGPAAPQMMGVYMQATYGDYLDQARAETQAVITFLCCALIGLLYVRAVTRQRAELS
jgi:putative spermidine/putrescine transport system permease protein